MANILIVEDEIAIADLISMNLKLVGHNAFQVSNGNDVMSYIEVRSPDLIILDIMLPGKDGFALMKEIEPLGIPVIFLTAKEELTDKITGLKLGADDYMVKPFAIIELLTRIETVLKRYRTNSNVFIVDNLEVHLDAHIILLKNEQVELTTKEFMLLELLIRNKNIALSRDKILELVWGYDYSGETRTVDVHVQRLRKKTLSGRPDQNRIQNGIQAGGAQMNFWQKAYLCVILIFLIGFDAMTYLSITKSYALNLSQVYTTAENERYVIQNSLSSRIASISSLYNELNADNLKMYIEPYGDYYNNQKIYMELYYNDTLAYSDFPHTLSDRSELQINPGQKSTMTKTVDGVSYYFITGYLEKPYSNIKFVYIKNIQDLADFKNNMLRHAIYSSIIVFIFLSVLLLALLLRLTGPIRKLNKGAEEIAAGHYQNRVEIKSRDEIGELACSFNKMADSVETHIQKLSDLTEARQQFINNLAHEMRTPITAIMGYGEILKYANLNDDERVKAVDYIIHQSERMKNMAGKLMDLASLTQKNMHFEKIDLKIIVENIEYTLSQYVAEKRIQIIKRLQGTQVQGDKDLLESLLQNIIENAVRVLPVGGKIEIETFEQETGLVLSISDNGIGMAEEELNKVFEPFYRVDQSRSRAYGGAGLGLALCKQICDLHHAQINVTSKPNKGTKFEIKFTTLPQLDDDSEK